MENLDEEIKQLNEKDKDIEEEDVVVMTTSSQSNSSGSVKRLKDS
jgi:hypothetical protein